MLHTLVMWRHVMMLRDLLLGKTNGFGWLWVERYSSIGNSRTPVFWASRIAESLIERLGSKI